jgi:hypothetical protein
MAGHPPVRRAVLHYGCACMNQRLESKLKMLAVRYWAVSPHGAVVKERPLLRAAESCAELPAAKAASCRAHDRPLSSRQLTGAAQAARAAAAARMAEEGPEPQAPPAGPEEAPEAGTGPQAEPGPVADPLSAPQPGEPSGLPADEPR